MPPQQTPPQYPVINNDPADHSQYDFIMNQGQPKNTPSFKGGKKPLLLIVGGLLIVLILVVVVFSFFSKNNESSKPFLAVAQEQQELVRVADLQYGAVSSQSTKNFVISTKSTMLTDNSLLMRYLAQNGAKISDKQLALGTHSTTDTALANAIATSTLDATLTKELQTELTTYKASLRQAYAATTGKNARALLEQFDKNADLLLAQSKQ
jgi:cytoskeletal protein RodZ